LSQLPHNRTIEGFVKAHVDEYVGEDCVVRVNVCTYKIISRQCLVPVFHSAKWTQFFRVTTTIPTSFTLI